MADLRLGFVGLGDMGQGMAANLVKAGFPLTVRDLRPEPLERLAKLGATVAATNVELGRSSDVVCVAVFDDAQVLDTCLGHDGDAGILAGLEPGGILAVHATVAPSTIHTLAASAAERGVHVLDVAMTGGGGQAAAEGALTFMIGGDAEPVERARPALEAMAKNLFHVGALGTGVTAKIINNCMGISHVVLVREALRLAGAVGIDDETILTIINAGGVGSNWASINWDRIRAQETTHTSGKAGMVGMASKDTQLGLDLATERGISLPTLAFLVHEVIPDLAATGLTG